MSSRECVCGADIHQIVLPEEIARQVGRDSLWVHDTTNDIYCYENDPAAWAEPLGVGRATNESERGV